MAQQNINSATVATTITGSDSVFISKNDNALQKIDYDLLAKAIIEQYTGSTLGGSARSLKTAIDALNSKPIFVMGDFDNDNWTLNLSQPYITFRWTNGYTGTVPTDGWGLCVQFHVVQLFFTSNHAWYRINVNGWGSWMLLGQ